MIIVAGGPSTMAGKGDESGRSSDPSSLSRALHTFLQAELFQRRRRRRFIAASSLTAATVTRRAASTSEWKIRVFTGGREGGWRGGDTATDSAQQVAPLPRAFLFSWFLPLLSSSLFRYARLVPSSSSSLPPPLTLVAATIRPSVLCSPYSLLSPSSLFFSSPLLASASRFPAPNNALLSLLS